MAARHLQSALQRGYCGGYGPRSLVPVTEPQSYSCGMCPFVGQSADDLRSHVLVHLPWPVYLTRSDALHLPTPRRHGVGSGGGFRR
eukprot:5438657-Pyramimonas_sp.AAC.1